MQYNKKSVEDIDVSGKKVIDRCDFNVPQDENGNAKVGKDIRLYECKNCVVHAADEAKVVVQGLDGYIIAEKHGQLLVCSMKEEQRIKEFGK